MKEWPDNLDKRDLLLLHLGDISDLKKEDDEFIDSAVKILDIEEETIQKLYSKLERKGEITEEQTGQDEIGEYALTEEGKKEKEKIWDGIKEMKVVLIDGKDAIQLKLKNVVRVLNDIPLIKIIQDIDDRGILDLREEEKPRDRLVDREEKVKKLKKRITEIDDKKTKTLFIAGGTGVGKTRLVEELKDMVLEEDFDFLEGKCFFEDQAPYAPFKRALSKFLAIERDLGKVQSVISPSRPSRGKVHSQKMFDTQRKSVFYGTSKFLKNLSEFRPIVIFLDNLQWADSATLNLLGYMAEKLKNEAVILIGAYRPGDVSESDPLKDTIRRMSRKKLYDKMELEPLEGKHIKKMISEITGVKEIPEDFADNLEEKTNGNPLFVRESLRQMMKEGAIDLKKGEFPTEGEIFQIPDVVQNVIEKRVFDLSEETREILQLGSVIGKEIPFDLLAKASDKEGLELLENIDPLLENNIWEENPRKEAFSFSHDLFVDTIYDGVGKWLERKKLHLKIAKAMESVFEDDLEDRYFTLGHHFRKGGDHEKAFKYFMKAGEKAERVYAHEDAIERYEEALMIANRTGEIGEEKVISLLKELGKINNIIGNYEEGREYLDRGLMMVKDLEKKRRMYRNIANGWFNQGKFDKVIEITDEALDLVNTDQSILEEGELEERGAYKKENTPEICNLLSKKGAALRTIGNYDEAKEIFSEELNRAKELKDRSILAQAYHDLASLERGGLNTEDCIQYLNKAIKIRKEILDEEESFKEKYNLFRSYNNLGAIYFESRDLDKALSLFEKALDINKKIKNKMFEALALNNIAAIKSKKGELEESEDILEDVFEIAEGILYKQGQFLAENTTGTIHLKRGMLDSALEHFEKGKEIAEEIDFKFGIIGSYENISKIFAFKGNLNEAKEYIDRGYKLAEEIKNERSKGKALKLMGEIKRLKENIEKSIDHHKKAIEINSRYNEKVNLFWNRCELVEDYLAKGDIENAEENLEKAKEENIETKDSDSKLKMLDGMVLRENGNFEESEDYLRESLELSKELSKKYRIARVKYELGKFKILIDNDEKAEEYLDGAKQLFEDVGMELRVEETIEALKKLE